MPRLPVCLPRFATSRNSDRATVGLEVATFLALLRNGGRPYPWQRLVGDVSGEIDESGVGYAYPIVVLVVPRRAGKTLLTLARGLAGARRQRDLRAWYTAQRREDAARTFRDEWVPAITSSDLLDSQFRLYRGAGKEGVWARRGSSRLQIFPPTETALHGHNADLVVFDEAWAFDTLQGDALEAAARPAQLTRPWRQLWIVSAGGTVESTWLDRWMTLGRQGAQGVAYFEWSADDQAADYDPADPAVWRASHPSLGYGFREDELAVLWATKTSTAEFERSYLNVWPRPSEIVAQAIPLEAWAACVDDASTIDEGTSISWGVDVTPERHRGAIAACAVRGDGRVHVEIVEHRPGVDWLVPRVAQLAAQHRSRCVALDPGGPAGALARDLEAAVQVPVVVVGGRDYAHACAGLYDDVTATRLVHRTQLVLDDAVTAARRRTIGDVWVWARRSLADICPLGAITVARFAATDVRGRVASWTAY
jgi:hypothetical protein